MRPPGKKGGVLRSGGDEEVDVTRLVGLIARDGPEETDLRRAVGAGESGDLLAPRQNIVSGESRHHLCPPHVEHQYN